ncbi:MAG: type I 3-dehydroquinate dehydratase, partial [Planctomycetes bacterium]|nr:type I 3-dehydroquinate dehydratase [Planctomycetota bacterium]
MSFTVSLLVTEPQALRAFRKACLPGADRVEIRLDHAIGGDPEEWRREIQGIGLPFVAALHGNGGLGSIAGSRAEHLRWLRAAAEWGAEWVDVDWSLAGEIVDLPEGARRIVSMHLTGERAIGRSHRDAYQTLLESSLPGDRIKFVVEARDAARGLEIMAWAKELPSHPAGRLLFCMGERVAFTRWLGLAQGDSWMYVAPGSSLDASSMVAAPGQITLDRALVCAPQKSERGPIRLRAVLGHPIDHSLSPEVQGAAYRAAGLHTYYLSIDGGPGPLGRDLLQAAVACGVEGFAITAPYKASALEIAEETTDAAQRVGAANTLAWRGDHFAAHNSDAMGVSRTLESAWPAHARARGLSPSLDGLRALLVGAGGAARAAREAYANPRRTPKLGG